MKTVCAADMCAGCKLCVDLCPCGAITIDATMEAYNARIDEDKCLHCGKCQRLCPQNNPPQLRSPIEWHQGWSEDESIRSTSSSGGAATEIARSFIERGGVVCTCCFEAGAFRFRFIDRPEDMAKAAGSKYVKSDPRGAYAEMLLRLKRGERVLFIGLPCQTAAAINAAQGKYDAQLYCIDLICHGTPSPEVLERFLRQRKINLSELNGIRFRRKGKFGLCPGYEQIEEHSVDEYTLAFLKGLTYTENCYHCGFARSERVSDLTLGDSWGSNLSQEERYRGISLMLCQSEKGRELIEMAKLELLDVNLQRAIARNRQLRAPSERTEKRDVFLATIRRGGSFRWAILQAAPKRAIRNIGKKYLYWIKRKDSTGGGTQ